MAGPHEPPSLYFWSREKTGSSAEVDYLWTIGQKILPIDSQSRRNRPFALSQNLYGRENHHPLGIRISTIPLAYGEGVLSIPFYLIGELNRLAI